MPVYVSIELKIKCHVVEVAKVVARVVAVEVAAHKTEKLVVAEAVVNAAVVVVKSSVHT